MTIQKGSSVEWDWGNGTAQGDVLDTFAESVTRSLKGSEITRHGEPGNKALLIEQEGGDQILKLESEVRRA